LQEPVAKEKKMQTDYKRLSEMIYKRQSVRVYSAAAADILENNANLLETFNVRPLRDDIRVKVKILGKNEVKNDRSPYCLAFYSEEKPFHLENIGFIGQQIELELQSKGLGTCWWGMKKPKKEYKKEDGLSCVITMTAGIVREAGTRSYPDGFKRKEPGEIIIGNTEADSLTEVVRIAPSAVNLQPWLVEKEGNKYNFYIRRPKSMMERLIKDMRHIDMGIAMAHLYIKAKADGLNASFSFEGKDINQGAYTASVIIT
jgi:nitroreductase